MAGPRIALVTARRAEAAARSVAERIAKATGWTVDVVVAPVEVAALIPRELLARLLRNNRGRYDLFIVPGSLGYSLEGLAEEAGAPVVRGPADIWGLELLAELGEDGLHKLAEKGELTGELLLEKWLKELEERYMAAPAVEACGVKIPVRPPPVLVAGEVFIQPGHVEETIEKLVEIQERGAAIPVMGFGAGTGPEEAGEAFDMARERGLEAVAVDTPRLDTARELLRSGACMLLSIGSWNLDWLEQLPHGATVVATPVRSDGSLPSGFRERLDELEKVAAEARSRGFKVIADPIVDPPGYGSLGLSIAAYFAASRELEDTPLMAGIANIYELVDADTHGQVAVLAQIYAEAGASLLLASEESTKARMAVTEAAIAATMVSVSLLKHRPPKDLGVDLLYAKEKRPVPQTGRKPRKPDIVLDASNIAAWSPFRPDRVGSHLIHLEDGRITDYYIGRKGTAKLTGEKAEHIYKAIAYLGYAGEPSHYAYLGYELCKAEHALLMKRSYVQEGPLLTPPWLKNKSIFTPRRTRRA